VTESNLLTPQVAAVVGALLLLVLGLSACGGGSESSSSSSTAGTTTTTGGGKQGKKQSSAAIRRFGHEATASQAGVIEAIVHGYFSARAASEWGRACSYLAKPNRGLFAKVAATSEEVTGKGCAAGMADLAKSSPSSERAELAKLDVISVRVKGRDGYALYRSAGDKYSIPTIEEAGSWRLTAAAGTPRA